MIICAIDLSQLTNLDNHDILNLSFYSYNCFLNNFKLIPPF